MFAFQRTRLRPKVCTTTFRSPKRPADRRFFIQSVCNGFLDLAIALPIPPSFPTYSTAIIAVTLVSRLALLPVSIWGKERTRRLEEIVVPEMEKLKPLVERQVFERMRAARVRGEKEQLRKMHAEEVVKVLTARRKELLEEHRCSPLPSIVIPPLAQLPVFLGFTVVLNRLSAAPTPFDSESFLTLTSLAHVDPTMTLPVVLGFLTMANVESSNWVMNAAEREQQRSMEEREAKRVADGGKPRIHPGKLIKTVLRGLSVVRIVIAALTPGSVALYWVTSAAFGLVQTWAMDWNDARRRRRRLATFQANIGAQLQPSPKSRTGKTPN
ncbi:hypothetical protein CPC08DRAFT_701796 [Agrocybe pediades]|nr:hypothetical protein CPC08DRAFT_701796 [Agrocybe pediades]